LNGSLLEWKLNGNPVEEEEEEEGLTGDNGENGG
jgi:hypothetical protein